MSSTTEGLLDELIDDAKLVAGYGLRAGLLKDTELISAISAVDSLPEKKWSAPEITKLQISLNAAAQAILPTTLVDLRSGWRPFHSSEDKSKKIAFVLFSFLLMITAAIFTFAYHHGSMIMAGLEDLQKEKPAEKIGHIARQLIGSEQLLTKIKDEKESSVGKEAYFQLIDQWYNIDTRLNNYISMSSEFIQENKFQIWSKRYLFEISGLIFGYESIAGTAKEISTSDKSNKQYYCSNAAGVANVSDNPTPGSIEDTSLGNLIATTKSESLAIACTQNVNFYPGAIPPIETYIIPIRNILSVYGLWLLPALYGALGATLYRLRVILNPILPDPSFARVAHRVALGAFAGIILAWFWSPSVEFEKDLSGVGLNLFAAAFLVGFSIDVFFALLDRFVSLTVGTIGRIGAASPQPQG